MQPVSFLTKPGAEILLVDEKLRLVAFLFTAIRAVAGIKEPATITSGTDGDHGERSFHYNGMAIDLRVRDLNSALARQVFLALKHALFAIDPSYFVALEGMGTPNVHIHVEYDRADGPGPITVSDRVR